VPHYVFTVQNSAPAPDTVEIQLGGPGEARSMAMTEASDMLRDHADRSWPAPDWWVHVTDEQGTTVCRLVVSGTTEG
jgi:hypothetical protein